MKCLVEKLSEEVNIQNPIYLNSSVIEIEPSSTFPSATINGVNATVVLYYKDGTSETKPCSPGSTTWNIRIKSVGAYIMILDEDVPASGLVLNMTSERVKFILNQLGYLPIKDLTLTGDEVFSGLTGELENIICGNLINNGEYSIANTSVTGDLTQAARNVVINGQDAGKTIKIKGNGQWIISTDSDPVTSVRGTTYFLIISAEGFVIREGSSSGTIIYQE